MRDSHPVSLDTIAVHAGETPRVRRAVVTPVFQSSTFELPDSAAEPGSPEGYSEIEYLRLSNTANHDSLHTKLAALEAAEDAVVTGSGMAAISTTLLALLDSGDHLLALESVYGGTHAFLAQDLARHGVEHTWVSGDDPDSWSRAVRPHTKVLYVETITNPLVRVYDLRAMAEFAAAHGLLAVIDNTFASPINCRPTALGFDLVIESATKYLNGHSDLVAGVVAGRKELVGRVRSALEHLGGILDAHACFLLQRGLKTLSLRIGQQNRSALAIAEMLAAHAAVGRVFYPGLPADSSHAHATEFLDGFGGMLAFELAGSGPGAVLRFVHALSLAVHATSLGGVETLVSVPAGTSHAPLNPAARARVGISDRLIRMSVGIEGTEDLLADLERALSA